MTPYVWKQLVDKESSRKEVAGVLRQAADHLEKVGLHKGGLFERNTVVDDFSKVPCCGWGAVEVVKDSLPSNSEAAYLAEEALNFAVGSVVFPKEPHLGHYPNWNDDPKRTQAEVLSMMRSTADAVETSSGVFA